MSYCLAEPYTPMPSWLALDPDARERFFAVWRAPDADAMRALISGIAASGWHEYFDTVNATGPATGLLTQLAQLASVPHHECSH